MLNRSKKKKKIINISENTDEKKKCNNCLLNQRLCKHKLTQMSPRKALTHFSNFTKKYQNLCRIIKKSILIPSEEKNATKIKKTSRRNLTGFE